MAYADEVSSSLKRERGLQQITNREVLYNETSASFGFERLGKVRHKSAPLLSDGKRLFVARASKSFEFLWKKNA